MSNRVRGLLDSCAVLGQRLLPQHCLLCTAAAPGTALCEACLAGLPWLDHARCPQCALPATGGRVCGACLAKPPRYDRVNAAFAYAWPLTPLLHDYKYGGNLALATMFARALYSSLGKLPADLIIPMPLAPERLRSRGFNQALEVARIASRLTGVQLAANACRRVRDSAPQASLPWRERAQNIRGAFVCDADLTGLRVAVLDDVMTTGATLNELARNLRRSGAIEVQGWMVARTLLR